MRSTCVLEDGSTIPYDKLIVATGTTHSYFGHDEWAPFAPGLKTLDDALEIRRRVLLAFERAERESDAAKRAAWLTFVVVGGGATGVELAGTFAEIARHTLRGEFRRIDPHSARVVLVEGTERVLPAYPPDLSLKAQLQLERLGVTVWAGRMVTGVDADGVSLGSERLASQDGGLGRRRRGFAARQEPRRAARPRGAGARRARPDGSRPSGDLHRGRPRRDRRRARHRARGEADGTPRRSQHQEIDRREGGPSPSATATTASSPPSAATPRWRCMGKVKLSGFPAWLVWLVAHIYFLINFRNRLIVMIDWGWAYLTYQRYARIIFGKNGTNEFGVRAVIRFLRTRKRITALTRIRLLDYLTSITPFMLGVQPADVVVLAGLVDGERGLLPAQEHFGPRPAAPP